MDCISAIYDLKFHTRLIRLLRFIDYGALLRVDIIGEISELKDATEQL